ncbi:MAG: hypothetical protein N2V75_04030 [Methanophagales archaeon]|nr:hypothetical protein [Methanophagales archaeon]
MADYGPGSGNAVIKVVVYALPELGDLIFEEPSEPVELNPGETKKIIAHSEPNANWILSAIGATDADFSEYWLKIGDKETTHTKEPFGLFNDPFNLNPAIKVSKGIEAGYYVKLADDAPGPVDYVAKMIGYKL